MTRDELQNNAAAQLQETGRLICEWATGTGKSNVALRFLQNNPGMSTLILVPEQNNIQNWKDEFDKFNIPQFGVTISCYASLHKYKDSIWDFIVLDETPHVDTDLRSDILSTMYADYILALGAVISEDEKDRLTMLFGKFKTNHISLKRAIDWGILVAPTVYVVHLELDDIHKKLMHNGKMVTPSRKYAELNQEVKDAVRKFEASSTEWNKINMLRTGNARKRFLGSQKDYAIRYICDNLRLKGRRFLCFCSTIKQAEELGKDHAFTSKTPVSMKVLEKFNNHEIDSLFVVGKLIEGQNLKDIDCGILGQLGGTDRITVQEIGRVLRSQKPVVYVPIFDYTKDNDFLETVTYNIPADCIKHYKLKINF